MASFLNPGVACVNAHSSLGRPDDSIGHVEELELEVEDERSRSELEELDELEDVVDLCFRRRLGMTTTEG